MSKLFGTVVDLLKGPDIRVTNNIVEFLKGYHRGIIASSNETFMSALKLGIGIGYRHGFRFGYERGFHDGFNRGFSAGLGDFLDEIVTVTKNIKDITGNVAKIVAVFG